MKIIIASLFITLFSAQAMADETKIISCTSEAQEQTMADLISNVRNKSGFEKGRLSIELEDNKDFQNMVLLKNYNEENDEVTYEATVAGTITNLDNSKTVFTINQCVVQFDASNCSIKSQLCSGI